MNAESSHRNGRPYSDGLTPGLLALGYSDMQKNALKELSTERHIRFFTETEIDTANVEALHAACIENGISAIAVGASISEAQNTLVQLAVGRNAKPVPALVYGDVKTIESAMRLIHENHHAQTELERESSARKKVFSLITHDLRSPFSSIIGVMQLLLADYEHMKDEDRKDFLRALLESAKTELDILDRLSQWGRSLDERLEPNMRMIPLDAIGAAVCRSLESHAEEKNVSMVSEIPLGFEVYADADMAQTALWQLGRNALAAAPHGSRVRFFLKDCETAGMACIAVEDQGRGFPEDIDPFEISRGSTESNLGIGLSMAKNLARRMNGRICIDRAGPGGTQVSLCLTKTSDAQ